MILSCSHIDKAFGTDTILSGVSFHIEDQEKLIEGNEIVKPAVDGIAPLRRNEVFRQEIQEKVDYPSQEQKQMGVFRGADIA